MNAGITKAEAYLVDIAVETVRTDAVQASSSRRRSSSRSRRPTAGTAPVTAYTIGTGGTAVLALLRDYLLPQLIGQDAAPGGGGLAGPVRRDPRHDGRRDHLAGAGRGRHRAVGLALPGAGLPLWVLAGGAKDRIPLYDTEGGWLHLPPRTSWSPARRRRQAAGCPASR